MLIIFNKNIYFTIYNNNNFKIKKMPRGSSPSSKPSGGFFSRSQPARP